VSIFKATVICPLIPNIFPEFVFLASEIEQHKDTSSTLLGSFTSHALSSSAGPSTSSDPLQAGLSHSNTAKSAPQEGSTS
jgi:hypothetical protein